MLMLSEEEMQLVAGGIQTVSFTFEGDATITFNDSCCDEDDD